MKSNCIVIVLLLTCFSSVAQVKWQSDDLSVMVTEKNILVFSPDKLLVDIENIEFNFQTPKSVNVTEQSPEKLILELTYPCVVDYYSPDEPKTATVEITPVKSGLRFHASPEWGNQVTITMRDQNEHYYGLLEMLYPSNQKSPDLRGTVVDVEAEMNAARYHENLTSVWSAFYMSSRGYASFFDSFSHGVYHLAVNGKTKIHHPTGELDWYLFYGPDGDMIHEAYYNIIGTPKYVPMWGCGPIIWRDQNENAEQIVDDVQKFTALRIPVTGWWVDRPYSDGAHAWSKMNFNDDFANPDEWISTLNEKYGIEFMTWVATCTFGDQDFPGLFPNYFGYFDLTDPEAVAEYERRLNDYQYSAGVRGHKMDRGEEHFPVSEPWEDGTPENQRRNKYLYLYAKVQHDIMQKALGKNHMNFARASFHRAQPYLNGLWGGDVRNTWDGMAANLANGLRCSFMGFPVWATDCGGYIGGGRISEELYTRWIQLGAWCGMFEVKIDGSGGSSQARPPWVYSGRFQQIFREVCEQRMALLPYIYSHANTAAKNGVLMKPLQSMYPEDAHVTDMWDEFLFGNAFLVAPELDTTRSREVYLPAGTWYDFDTLESYAGNTTYPMDVPINETPVFVKANSIYLTGQLLAGNSVNWIRSFDEKRFVNIHAFPGKVGEKTVFQYVDVLDNDRVKNISLQRQNGGIVISAPALATGGSIEIKTEKPEKVTINGEKKYFDYDKIRGVAKINFQQEKAVELIVTL